MAALTAEETELYDRQIRAWGFDAQKRMRESKILVVGLDGAGSETLKNLVLAGLGNITILEDSIVDTRWIETHFYIQQQHLNALVVDVALHYFAEMNPMITLNKDSSNAFEKSDAFYESFDVVIVSNCARNLQLRIDAICHQQNIGFFSSRSMGRYGYVFADLQRHKFQLEVKNSNDNNSSGNNNNNGKQAPKNGASDDEKLSNKLESAQWYSLQSALAISNKSLMKQLRKKEHFRRLFYALQVCEQIEDVLLSNNKDWICKPDQLRDAMQSICDAQSVHAQIYKDVEANIKSGKQFNDADTNSDEMIKHLLSVWNLSVCPSNAILGGYLANFVMFYVQRKQKPLHNFLFFDMWNCEALEVVMRNEADEKLYTEQEKAKEQKKAKEKEKQTGQNVTTMEIEQEEPSVDITNLSVEKNKGKSAMITLSESDDDDPDIDLTK